MRLTALALFAATAALVLAFVVWDMPASGVAIGESPTPALVQLDEGLPKGHPGNVVSPSAPADAVSDAVRTQARAVLEATTLSEALAALPRLAAAPLTAPGDAAAPADLVEELIAFARATGREPSPIEVAAMRADAAALPPEYQAELARLVRALREGAALVEAAQAGLTPEERARLVELAPLATRAMRDVHLPASERAAVLREFDTLASGVDLALIERAGHHVASAVDAFVAATSGISFTASGDVLFTDFTGYIVIGGTGPTSYSGFHVLVVDLGGDDVYEDSAGGVAPGAPFPVSVVIDRDGNDQYHPQPAGGSWYARSFVQGAAYLGVGVLVDLAGDDAYASGISLLTPFAGDATYYLGYAQGAGMLGVGILADAGGNDAYASDVRVEALDGAARFTATSVQGFAWGGVGLLADGFGSDAYTSRNLVDGRSVGGHAVGILVASYCQGAVMAGGVAVLADGVPLAGVPLAEKALASGGGRDAYGSYNTLYAQSGDLSFGKTSIGQQLSVACQGVSVMGYTLLNDVRALVVPGALGLLVDGEGDDRYNSGNVMRGFTRESDSDSGCGACHASADLTVLLNQGASGSPYDFHGQATGVGVGVLVDGAGDDAFNSENDLEARSFSAIRPTPLVSSTLTTRMSMGYAGASVVAQEVREKDGSTGNDQGDKGCEGSPIPSLTGGMDLCAPVLSCSLRALSLTPATPGERGAAIGVPGCRVGVLLNLGGSDRYVADNRLAASGGQTDLTTLSGDLTLGAADTGGIGVFVDGLTSLYGDAYAATCSRPPAPCAAFATGTRALNGGSDHYYSRNTLTGSEAAVNTLSVQRSYGAGEWGVGVFVDVTLLPLDVALAPQFFNPSPPLVAAASLGWGSGDVYSSWNTCSTFTSYRNYGATGGLAAAFVDVGGSDTYDQNSGCALDVHAFGQGTTTATPGLGLFVDLFGADQYPGGSPGSNDTAWLRGTFGLGLDLLP